MTDMDSFIEIEIY